MDFRFLLKPKWLLSHVAVLALIVTMIGLGFWQLDRLAQKKAITRQILDRRDLSAEPIEKLLPLAQDDAGADISELRYRTVTVEGSFGAEDQVLISNRTLEGAPGYWVVAPVDLNDGSSQLVLRGWIPLSQGVDGPLSDGLAPPSGPVTVTGAVMVSESDGVLGSNDGTNRRDELLRLNSERFQAQTDRKLRSGFVQLVDIAPAASASAEVKLTPVPLPQPGDGPHLSYAVQWFVFTTIALIGYPIVIRRVARQRGGGGATSPPEWE